MKYFKYLLIILLPILEYYIAKHYYTADNGRTFRLFTFMGMIVISIIWMFIIDSLKPKTK